MANKTYTVQTGAKTLYASDGWQNITFDAIPVSAGETFVKWIATTASGSGQVELRDMSYTPRTWGAEYTNAAGINCSSNYNTPRYQARFNASSGTINVSWFKLEVTVSQAYTAVTAGNKILATDRSQTGTTTTQGAVMSDSHFTAGTLIEASTFNSQVLGL